MLVIQSHSFKTRMYTQKNGPSPQMVHHSMKTHQGFEERFAFTAINLTEIPYLNIFLFLWRIHPNMGT